MGGCGVLVTGGGVTLFGQDRAANTGMHQQPAYKLVVALGGHLAWGPAGGRGRPGDCGAGGQRLGRGVLVPPGVAHAVSASGAHRCLLVEPWVGGVPQLFTPMALSDELSRQLAADLEQQCTTAGGEADLVCSGRAVMERLRLQACLPERRVPRTQVQRAAAAAGAAGVLEDLAASVGLSGVRLRQLVRSELGVTLGRLRLWQRLTAMARTADGATPLARSAVAVGFSDQAHLTRTSQQLAGRTPAQVLHARDSPSADPQATGSDHGKRIQPLE